MGQGLTNRIMCTILEEWSNRSTKKNLPQGVIFLPAKVGPGLIIEALDKFHRHSEKVFSKLLKESQKLFLKEIRAAMCVENFQIEDEEISINEIRDFSNNEVMGAKSRVMGTVPHLSRPSLLNYSDISDELTEQNRKSVSNSSD